MNIAGCVLAGGNGSRAEGRDKCMFTYEGKTFLERSMEVFLEWDFCMLSYNRVPGQIQEVLQRLNQKRSVTGKTLVRIISDREEVQGIGPMAGLYSLLMKLDQETEAILVTPCDVPFFQKKLVDLLVSQFHSDVDAVVMTSHGKLQPLCGIYSKTVLPVMKNCITEKIYKPRCVLEQVNTCYLAAEEYDIPDLFFDNINTMEELKQLQEDVDKTIC